jgi:ArsR family transcriptional regulator, zinc-responsive transcriptional repressor
MTLAATKDAPAGKLPALTPLVALEQAAECLRTLAHPHRLRMLQMLLRDRYTVGELAEACGIPSHMASEHLRLMQRCGFLSNEKQGRRAYYHIAEMHLAGILACVESRFGGQASRAGPASVTSAGPPFSIG